MHTRTLLRASLALCAIMLAACAAQSTPPAAEETVAVSADRNAPPPPPLPPPLTEQQAQPPVTGRHDMRGAMGNATATPYAQYAPQPLPGDIDRDRYEHQNDNPIHQVSADPISTFSIDVDSASYANTRRYLNEGRLPPRDAVRVEELINYFHYDYRCRRAARSRSRPPSR